MSCGRLAVRVHRLPGRCPGRGGSQWDFEIVASRPRAAGHAAGPRRRGRGLLRRSPRLERVSPSPRPSPPAAAAGSRSGDVVVHLGVEEDFRPARKAHPAFVVDDLAALITALEAAGVAVRPNPDAEPGAGAYVDDPFGNRIELIADRREAGREFGREAPAGAASDPAALPAGSVAKWRSDPPGVRAARQLGRRWGGLEETKKTPWPPPPARPRPRPRWGASSVRAARLLVQPRLERPRRGLCLAGALRASSESFSMVRIRRRPQVRLGTCARIRSARTTVVDRG